MKTTGVVRRIDELGRIVVPKEIRRSLKIRDGESLEIFVDKDIVALKKYYPMGDLKEFAKILVDSVHNSLNCNIIITDRDTIIASAGENKKKYADQNVSKDLESAMSNRNQIVNKEAKALKIIDSLEEEVSSIITPIIVNGDPIGAVIITNSKRQISETEEKIANIIAQFLGKHIEE